MREFILKLSRESIENYVKTGKRIDVPTDFPEELKEKRGVFVTLYKKGMLRGCIGLPYPQKPLIEGLVEAACLACRDPRFEPLEENELKNIKIEVSVLTEPVLIENFQKNYKKEIELGKHGLIIRNGIMGGLFLPKVPIDQKWNLEQYLENLCYKAGLTADSWLDPMSKIYKFEANTFSEPV
ncbi:MAG: TIGR00296 family protein [Candidatus Aenigmatarchaeota archaeon]